MVETNMIIAFIRPNYPDETRVAVVPKDLAQLLKRENIEVWIESGFGQHLGYSDEQYISAGASIHTREECFEQRVVFNLKLTQEVDYPNLKRQQTIIGWTHPSGSGKPFFENICRELDIRVVDVDSVYPRVYCKNKTVEMDYLPPHFFWKNSYNAGIASVGLASSSLPSDLSINVCILGSGSVSQGAFFKMSQLGYKPRLFYRKTMHIFRSLVETFDVIINGIEVDTPNLKIIDKGTLLRTKPSVLIIDAAADADNAIEGTDYQPVHNPFSIVCDRKYLLVNNAPSSISKIASKDISYVLCNSIFPCMLQNKDKWLF